MIGAGVIYMYWCSRYIQKRKYEVLSEIRKIQRYQKKLRETGVGKCLSMGKKIWAKYLDR